MDKARRIYYLLLHNPPEAIIRENKRKAMIKQEKIRDIPAKAIGGTPNVDMKKNEENRFDKLHKLKIKESEKYKKVKAKVDSDNVPEVDANPFSEKSRRQKETDTEKNGNA